MSKYRRAAKVDSNQSEIVKSLRQIPGVSVATGHDDILVGYQGCTYWFEVKASAKAVIKPSQVKLQKEWTGHYQIVSTLDEILASIGVTSTMTIIELFDSHGNPHTKLIYPTLNPNGKEQGR